MLPVTFYVEKFDQTKPYAEVTVKRSGTSALGKIRTAGEVLLVNYGSPQWEATVDELGVSYLENEDLFNVRRIDPARDVSQAAPVVVVEEKTAPVDAAEEPVTAAEPVSDVPVVAAFEQAPVEAPDVPAAEKEVKATTPRKSTTGRRKPTAK